MITQNFDQFHRQDVELRVQREKANKFLQKFRWVSSDKSRLEKMIEDLRYYNDGLYHHLSAIERRRLRQGLPPELIRSDDLNVLNNLRHASDSRVQGLLDVVALREHRVAVQATSGVTRGITSIATEIPFSDIKISLDAIEHGRSMASYHQGPKDRVTRTSVLIEWKHLGQGISDGVRSSLVTRIQGLTQLLHDSNRPESLCVPKCLGYTSDEDKGRLGIVYELEIKSTGGSNKKQLSLQKLLGGDIPHLGERFRLAWKLALSLSTLHTAGWLHKGIRSSNIIFQSSLSVTEPSIIGFEFARPNVAYAFSSLTISSDHEENLYRHPKAQGPVRERFSRAFDIYALGMVLFEIAYWRRVETFWVKGGHTADTFREDIWSFHIPNLGAKVGKVYMDVVNKCISGRAVDETLDDFESQKMFYREVVGPLSGLVA